MEENEQAKPERAPWDDFPDVITNGALGGIEALPEYRAAKAGDIVSAWELVQKALKAETIQRIQDNFKLTSDVVIVPVLAEESSGRNKIPLAVAIRLAKKLGTDFSTDILQANHVGRTEKDADARLVFQPVFKGEVQQGQKYLLVDDTLTVGGTLASLRAYIHNRGGKVIGAMVMSSKQQSLQLSPSAEMVVEVLEKYGNEINHYWKKEFGYGIEQLTQSELKHLSGFANADTLRARITQARYVGSRAMGYETAGITESEELRLAEVVYQLRENHHPKAILKTEKPTTPCRGRVVFDGEDFVIQQVDDGSRYFQKHRKEDLSRVPLVGEKVNISYAATERLARVRSMGLRR